MSDPLRLIKLALNNEVYEKHKHLFLDQFFSRPVDKVWNSIKSAHEKYKRDLTTQDVYELLLVNNGTMTSAAKEAAYDLLERVKELEPVGEDVALEVLKAAYSHELGRSLIEESYSLIEGKEFNLPKAKELLEQIENGSLPSAIELEYVPTDVEELLAQFDDTKTWAFNIVPLQAKTNGLPPGTFSLFFARPECGKSLTALYMACGPGGFCEQKAKVLYLANEEYARRQMVRAVSSFTGLTLEEIKHNPKKASELFTIRDNIRMVDAGGWTTTEVRNYCKEFAPDVIIVDQVDKLKDFPNLEGHARLRDLYTEVREVGKEFNAAIIGICQASVEAEGKSILDYSMTEGSRTGKAAELDLCVGIGVNSIVEKLDGNNYIRTFNLCKNKLSGDHSSFNMIIQPHICRFKE